MFDYVRLSSIMFDCWTVWLPNVRLCSIGKMFWWVRLSSITEPNRTQTSDWVRLPNVRLATPGLKQWQNLGEKNNLPIMGRLHKTNAPKPEIISTLGIFEFRTVQLYMEALSAWCQCNVRLLYMLIWQILTNFYMGTCSSWMSW